MRKTDHESRRGLPSAIRFAVVLGMLFVAALAGLAAWLASRGAAQRMAAAERPVRWHAERHAGRLMVPATIRGEDVGWLVVDTGADREAVTPGVVESVGLTGLVPDDGVAPTIHWAHDVTSGEHVVLDGLVVAGRSFPPRAALVVDERRLPSAPGREVVGILGLPALGSRFRIDFERNVVDARLGRAAATASTAAIARHMPLGGSATPGDGEATAADTDLPTVLVELPDGETLRLAIDTGQRRALMLTSEAASQLDWSERARYRMESPVVDVEGRLLLTPRLTILGHEREPFLAWAPDVGTDDSRGRTHDGRLGTNALEGLVLTFDRDRGELLVEGTPLPIPDETEDVPRVHAAEIDATNGAEDR